VVRTRCKHRCRILYSFRNCSKSSITPLGNRACLLEHRELGQDVGASEFLYPSLGTKKAEDIFIVSECESILMKVRDDTALRRRLAFEESEHLGAIAWLSVSVSQKEQTHHL